MILVIIASNILSSRFFVISHIFKIYITMPRIGQNEARRVPCWPIIPGMIYCGLQHCFNSIRFLQIHVIMLSCCRHWPIVDLKCFILHFNDNFIPTVRLVFAQINFIVISRAGSQCYWIEVGLCMIYTVCFYLLSNLICYRIACLINILSQFNHFCYDGRARLSTVPHHEVQ